VGLIVRTSKVMARSAQDNCFPEINSSWKETKLKGSKKGGGPPPHLNRTINSARTKESKLTDTTNLLLNKLKINPVPDQFNSQTG